MTASGRPMPAGDNPLRRWLRRVRLPGLRLPAETTQRNIACLYGEAAWDTLIGAAATFSAVYAVRLGASNALIGWLSSLPALFSMLLLVPAARFLESRAQRTRWLWGGLLLGRLSYLAIALVPWLLASRRAEVVVVALIAGGLPSILYNAGWGPLWADVVPEADRTRVNAWRGIVGSAGIAVVTVAVGKWLETADRLHWAPFPANYQILYLAGFVTSLAGVYYLTRMRVPPAPVVPWRNEGAHPLAVLREARRMFQEAPEFGRFTLNTLLFAMGECVYSPLIVIFLVRQLGATDAWVGLNATIASVASIIGLALWRHGVRRLGSDRAMRLTAPLSASAALLTALFPNLGAILLFNVLVSLNNPGLGLSANNLQYLVTPRERRASYMAVYSTLTSATGFVFPMVGVALAGIFGVRAMILAGGLLRVAGALMFHANRLHVQEESIH